ncbi:hypothetical protein C942_04593 [Photobacterium marinum]|uniref:SWIM-type domain-containing protein n=1 Tax=Photobacterium marinum TaxID=1056511 RepID=L8JH98_9GAMM|nr:hypothetical protein [Photobacterium marinum]ELR66894.1 hypothetical protein C942_04593 [Photobacterium marinum]
MTLLAWTQQITDEFLLTWTNRGLLRRAKKQAANADITQWQIEENTISGHIDSFQVTLATPELTALQCDCGALEPCSHKIAFILALQSLPASQPAASPVAFELAPWLVENYAELEAIFGKTKSQKALTSWHKGAPIKLSTHPDHALIDCQIGKKTYQVYLPAQVDWSRLVCSCQETRCQHQALAIIGLSVQESRFTLPSEQQQTQLKEPQQEKIKEVEHWLNQILGYGLKNVLPIQLTQGESFVTELGQHDLPKIATLLGKLLRTLDGVTKRHLTATADIALEQIGQLLLYLRAIQAAPSQLPLYQLAGRHKRQYTPVTLQDVMAVSAEYWHSEDDARGYRFYLYERQAARWYCISEGRKAHMDRSWDHRAALKGQRIITADNQTVSLPELALQSVDFKGQVSDNQSLKIDRLLSTPQTISWDNLVNDPSLSVHAQWQRLGNQYSQPFFDPLTDALGWVITDSDMMVAWHSHQAYGSCTVETLCGQTLAITLGAHCQRKAGYKGPKLLFGRWAPSVSAVGFHVLDIFTATDFNTKAKSHAQP